MSFNMSIITIVLDHNRQKSVDSQTFNRITLSECRWCISERLNEYVPYSQNHKINQLFVNINYISGDIYSFVITPIPKTGNTNLIWDEYSKIWAPTCSADEIIEYITTRMDESIKN